MNIIDDLLTPNPYSRPGQPIIRHEYISLHWFANPGTSAKFNRDYWESRKHGDRGYGGGHFAVDASQVLCCIPTEEIAYHLGSSKGYSQWTESAIGTGKHEGVSLPNWYTIGVEMAHENWEGEINEETWNNAVELVARLCERFNRDPFRDIITHNIVVGWKECPRWMVTHPGELQRFQLDVAFHMGAAA